MHSNGSAGDASGVGDRPMTSQTVHSIGSNQGLTSNSSRRSVVGYGVGGASDPLAGTAASLGSGQSVTAGPGSDSESAYTGAAAADRGRPDSRATAGSGHPSQPQLGTARSTASRKNQPAGSTESAEWPNGTGGPSDPAESSFPVAMALACGSAHTVVLCEGGVCYAFGKNEHGQLGLQYKAVAKRVATPKRVYIGKLEWIDDPTPPPPPEKP